MKEETTRNVGKSLPQESRQKHKVVIMHEHDVPFLVDASDSLQEQLVCVRIRLVVATEAGRARHFRARVG